MQWGITRARHISIAKHAPARTVPQWAAALDYSQDSALATKPARTGFSSA
jgi:hypothetical protein